MWKCCSPKNPATVNIGKLNHLQDQSAIGEQNEEDILVDRYNSTEKRKFYMDFKELIEGYENYESKFIDMSQPRDASYATRAKCNLDTSYEILETMRLGKDVSISSRDEEINIDLFVPSSYRSMPTEVRGITLRQLRAIIPLIKRRCEEEQWTRPVYKDGVKTEEVDTFSFEAATLYDINNYVIKPFTKYSQKSFVETLPSTKGTQPPHWFVSHFWGETFVHTLACLEEMVKDFDCNEYKEDDARGGGMTEDTPIWICAFANNQHNLMSEITSNPADSAFAKAMRIANFRVISILDVKNQVYSRLWCIYELYLTLILSKKQGIDGLLAVYTYHEHDHWNRIKSEPRQKSAVGFIEDGPTCDSNGCNESEEQFPKYRFFKSLSVSVQDAEASEDNDRKHILNALVGRSGDDMELEPLRENENYENLNNAVRGAFASTEVGIKFAYNHGKEKQWKETLYSALSKGDEVDWLALSDDEESSEDDEESTEMGTKLTYNHGKKEYWNDVLHAIKNSVTKSMKLDYLEDFNSEDAADLFHHLPIGLEKLNISYCPHGRVAMDAFFNWLENTSTNLKGIGIQWTCIGGDVDGKECGERLARFLARDDCKIEVFVLYGTDLVGSRNVDTWIECLDINESLKDVYFTGMAENVKKVGDSEKPNTLIDAPAEDVKGRIYWDGTTFPDATFSKEQEEALKESLSQTVGEDGFDITYFVLRRVLLKK